ncbi:hypothetical protein ABU614_03390 [Lysobacter firmicutimachus]|uniref:Sel1 repeat family protein n=1 Tax=Lysobacter firmicutimachus TaxID=1792846 RepID=A0AAU8MTG7_9GAMM
MRASGFIWIVTAFLVFSTPVSGRAAGGQETNNMPVSNCLKEKALMGDPGAAKLCAEDNLKGDRNLVRYWTQVAAENGDPVSQYNFAMILLGKKSRHDRLRAIFWLKKSSQNGFVLAKQVLEDIRKNPNATIPIAPPPAEK